MAKDQDSPIRVVQLTDTHLYSEGSDTLLKMNTKHSFEQVLELIQLHEGSLDLILATGDVAQDASAAAYDYFKSSIGGLNVPFMWLRCQDEILSSASTVHGESIDFEMLRISAELLQHKSEAKN